MILLVDMSYRKDSLSTMEFVHPVNEIAEESGFDARICHRNEISEEAINSAEKIILCGTALMDNAFQTGLHELCWIRDFQKPLLGICAGMQAISIIFGGNLLNESKIGIHVVKADIRDPIFGGREEFTAYEMHSYGVLPPEDFSVIARSGERPVVIRHMQKDIYCVLFHPEVRNEWFVRNFLEI